MKVSISDFELHLMPFMKKIVDTMPSSLHKWLGGAMMVSSVKNIEGALAGLADKDGMIELDDIRKIVKSGFESSGGSVVIPFGSEKLKAFGITPVNTTITVEDSDQFFSGFGR